MFKKNTKHLQKTMFGLQNTMPESLMQHAVKSEEYHFYNIVFCNIDEDIFSDLYSDKKSRPNSPINSMVAALLFQNRRSWTYDELFNNLRFNLLFKMAIGLDDLETIPFCQATLFNFQNRLNDHFVKTGENLLEKVFDHLTEDQLKALKLKTSIQRTDSTFAASNIRNYTHLQLLVEMLIRTYRVLDDDDKARVKERFDTYIKRTSSQYVYTVKASDIPHELEKIAQLYLWINQHVKPKYSELLIFKTFERVLHEHFTIKKDKIQVRSRQELHSGCLQSPDDLDATYRNKNGKKSKGQVINAVETAHPDNSVNLITDVVVAPNNKDDSRILNERVDRLKEKTPDLEELHMDAAYGSSENDRKFSQHDITPVQSDMRGKEAVVPIEIDKIGKDEFIASCPHQKVKSKKCKKRFKAEFKLSICQQCDKQLECSTIQMKKYRVYYFTVEDFLRKQRLKKRASIPKTRLKLRNNVESTMNEFACRMPRGKLKVRGSFKIAIFAYTVAMSSNFGRIYRYIAEKGNVDSLSFSCFWGYFRYFKEQLLLFMLKIILYSRSVSKIANHELLFVGF